MTSSVQHTFRPCSTHQERTDSQRANTWKILLMFDCNRWQKQLLDLFFSDEAGRRTEDQVPPCKVELQPRARGYQKNLRWLNGTTAQRQISTTARYNGTTQSLLPLLPRQKFLEPENKNKTQKKHKKTQKNIKKNTKWHHSKIKIHFTYNSNCAGYSLNNNPITTKKKHQKHQKKTP